MLIRILFLSLLVLSLTGCVQKSSKKIIHITLHVKGIKNIQSVGIRGNEKPLSWDYDMPLTPIFADSIYTTTFSLITGYTFTEAKFTVNGQFELNEKDNRKIIFSDSDTTHYAATYNVIE